MHAAAAALLCMRPALAGACGGRAGARCAYGAIAGLTAACAAAGRGTEELQQQQLLQLGHTLQPLVAEYAISAQQRHGPGQVQGREQGDGEEPFDLAPVWALLTAAPLLLAPFLEALVSAAAADGGHAEGNHGQTGAGCLLAAMQVLCQLVGMQGLRAGLLGLQPEVAHAAESLREMAAVSAREPTLLGTAVADASARLEGMRRTLYGLDLL